MTLDTTETTTAGDSTQQQIETMVNDAVDGLEEIHTRLITIAMLNSHENLKHLTKDSRNHILTSLGTKVDALDETVKALMKAVKKVKRVRIDEDKIEKLMGVPDTLRGPAPSGFDEKGFGEG